VKHGDVSASVPKGQAPETVTLADAIEWIAAKAGTKGGQPAAPAARTRARKAPDLLTARVKRAPRKKPRRAGGRAVRR
jgi:DNA topoisomerase-1